MNEPAQNDILLEKTLYQYTSVVERGDFDAAASILAQAEDDPRLEAMIVEINGALADELPPAPKLRADAKTTRWQSVRAALRALAPGVALSVMVLLLGLGFSALMGPSIGSTFSNTSLHLLSERGNISDRPSGLLGMQPTQAPQYTQAAAHQAIANSSSYPAAQQMPALPASTATPYKAAAVAAPATPQPRLVVRNGYLTLTVADTRKSRDVVAEVVSQYAGEGAFILSSAENPVSGSDQPMIAMQLRVPVARYDAVISRLVGMALTIDARQEQAQDVTAEYVDAQARIKELQTAIARLLEIASQAKTTEDLLRVERELSNRRAELESYEGRAQYLYQTAALSLIDLRLQPKVIYPSATPTPMATPAAWQPQQTAYNAWLVLLNDLRHFGDAVIVFGITTAPWIAAVGLVAYGGYRVVRRKK